MQQSYPWGSIDFHRFVAREETPVVFTQRQAQTLRMMAERALCQKELAVALGLSIGTVKVHISAVLAVLGARSALQAVVMYWQSAELRAYAETVASSPAHHLARVQS